MMKILRLAGIVCAVLFSASLTAQQKLSYTVSASHDVKTPYGTNINAGKYVISDGAKIYYEVYGNGTPIVLLHGGIMGSMDEMAEFIENLKSSYKVIAISTRGHGKSDIGKLPITYELKANDIIKVINETTKDSVTIIGFSDGAYTGYKVASLYPNKVKKLVAIGAGEQVPGLRKVVFSGEAFDTNNDFWKKKLSIVPEPNRIKEFWSSMENFYNSMSASKELFNSIKCPVLVMAGENDKNALLTSVISAYNMIPNSQLSIIPNTGHVVFVENFPAVWASIVPFLNK